MKRRAKRRRTYHRRGMFKFKLKKETIYTIAALMLFAAAGIVAIAPFQSDSFILRSIFQYTRTYFGILAYGLPLLLFSIGLLFFRLRAAFARPTVSVGLLLVFMAFGGLARTGFLGELLWENLSFLISDVGAWFILLATLAIGISVLLDTSLDEIVYVILIGVKGFYGMVSQAIWDRDRGAKQLNKKELAIKEGTAAVSDQTNAGMKQAVIISPAKKDLGLSPTSLTNQPGEKSAWEYPPLSLLQDLDDTKADAGDVRKNAHTIEQTLDSFGIRAHVIEVNLGPAVAQYAIEIAQGTKLTKITSLSNDLALALAAPTGQIRIEAPIPGRSLVGVEVPNRSLRIVTLKEMLVSQPVREARSKLAVGLGLDVSGQAIIGDIATMPHALIAGTTGSGKSVMMNTLISSLLYRTTPQEVRLILVDPKRVELTQYNDIPHLLTPVIVEPDQTLSALKWAQDEMDRRYKMFAEKGARNIESYNDTLGYQALPYIVIFIDELADLMLFAAAEVEDKVTRIAQMARATGIHLILSTQRPSVNVITGLIKANIPTRVAFNVSSMVDSRVILDVPGAEKLLGRGDMLYTPPDRAKPLRVQGTYVSEKEVKQLVDFFKQRAQAKGIPIEYTEEVTQQRVTITQPSGAVITPDGQDALFEEAKLIVTQYDRASASLLQRRLKIGYARAARILDQLEATGIVGPAEGSKPREVLMRGNVGEGV